MQNEKIVLDIQKLPIIIELNIKGIAKDYVVKANKDKTGIFLNKKELF